MGWILLEYPHNAFGRVAGLLSMIVSFGTFSQQYLLLLAQNSGKTSRWPFVQLTLGVLCFVASIQMYLNYGHYINTIKTQEKNKTESQKFDLTDNNSKSES